MLGLGVNYLLANAVAIGVSIVFAFFTNRRWVFHSNVTGAANICREFTMFAAVRGLSSLFDMAGLYIMVSLLAVSEVISKLVVAMSAALLNYGFSKRVIFRKRKNK